MNATSKRLPVLTFSCLYEESQRQPLLPGADATPPQPDFSLTQGSVVTLLDDTAFDKRYLSPTYLRTPLGDFLARDSRGLFWLRAPGHVGKSMFVLGLSELNSAITQEKPLHPGLTALKVAAVFIKREYRYGPAQIASRLEDSLKKALDATVPSDRRLPQLDLAAADKPAAFARFLAEFRALSWFRGPLLIVLDGLDELRPPDDKGSVVDFIPTPAQLPEHTYILLTARTQEDHACPAWIDTRLTHRIQDHPQVCVHRVDLTDPGYLALLRAYFDRELGEARATAERRALDEGTTPAAAKDRVAGEFNTLFADLLAKADGLFLYLAFLIDLVKAQALALDDIAKLPTHEGLFTRFLDSLPDTLAPKQAELAHTVLLTLAAVEQAHTWYIEDREPPFAVSPDWRGVPFDTLTELVHQQHAEGALVYLLFRLKSALGSWRGEAAPSARYRIGVKGLTEAIAAHPTLKPALQATHKRLVQELLALLAPAPSSHRANATGTEAVAMETPTPPPVDALRLHYALAHADLSGEAALADALAAHTEYQRRLRQMCEQTYHQAYYQRAMQWATLEILVRERVLKTDDSAEEQNDLASAYNNRGNAHRALGALDAAVEDYERAVRLWESLRAVLEPQGNWPKFWQGYLAQVQKAHQQVTGVLESQAWQRQFQEHEVQAQWHTQLHQALSATSTPWPWPPFIPGAWQTDADLGAAVLFATIKHDEKIGRILMEDASHLLGFRRLDVTFYPGWQLWEAHLQSNGQSALFAGLSGPGETLVLLTENSDVVHQLNQQIPVQLSTDAEYCAYTRFFCAAIAAEEGRFCIVETPQELPWLPDVSAEACEAIAAQLQPFQTLEVTEQGARFQGTCLYGSHLFEITLATKPNGRVEMVEDNLLADDLPVLRERLDGPLRWIDSPRDQHDP